jgi:hypothetical protein
MASFVNRKKGKVKQHRSSVAELVLALKAYEWYRLESPYFLAISFPQFSFLLLVSFLLFSFFGMTINLLLLRLLTV